MPGPEAGGPIVAVCPDCGDEVEAPGLLCDYCQGHRDAAALMDDDEDEGCPVCGNFGCRHEAFDEDDDDEF